MVLKYKVIKKKRGSVKKVEKKVKQKRFVMKPRKDGTLKLRKTGHKVETVVEIVE